MSWRGIRAPRAQRQLNQPKAIRLVRILDQQVRADLPTAIMQVESEKGFIGVRVSGTTGGVGWSVDLYGGNCYVVRVDGFPSERQNTPIRVLHLLHSRLPPCSTSS